MHNNSTKGMAHVRVAGAVLPAATAENPFKIPEKRQHMHPIAIFTMSGATPLMPRLEMLQQVRRGRAENLQIRVSTRALQ